MGDHHGNRKRRRSSRAVGQAKDRRAERTFQRKEIRLTGAAVQGRVHRRPTSLRRHEPMRRRSLGWRQRADAVVPPLASFGGHHRRRLWYQYRGQGSLTPARAEQINDRCGAGFLNSASSGVRRQPLQTRLGSHRVRNASGLRLVGTLTLAGRCSECAPLRARLEPQSFGRGRPGGPRQAPPKCSPYFLSVCPRALFVAP